MNDSDETLHFEFHAEFINYLNDLEHSITLIQKEDFKKIKGI